MLALFAKDAPVLDINDSVGELGQPLVVRDYQHGAARILGDARQDPHNGHAVLGIQCAGRFVRKNGRWSAHQGTRNRDSLLLATAEFPRKGSLPVAHADHREGIPCPGRRGACVRFADV